MEKHLLLTIGDDPSGFYAVRFAGNLLHGVPDAKFTLFYVTPKAPEVFYDDRNIVESRESADRLVDNYRGRGRGMLALAKKKLLELGHPPENIFEKVQQNQFGTAEDVVQEAEAGLYDALVLGRRGVSRFEELFTTSISKHIFLKNVTFPLWVCKRPIVGWKDILICLDRSQGSYRAVDHVGFICSGLKDRKIVLFHVDNGLIKPCTPETVFEEAKAILRGAGVPDDVIRTKIVKGADPTAEIQKEVKTGKYAVAAVGRRGSNPDTVDVSKPFLGAVAVKLFHELESSSLWVC